jgi:hypothetical protein
MRPDHIAGDRLDRNRLVNTSAARHDLDRDATDIGVPGACGYMYVRQRDLVYYPQETRVEACADRFLAGAQRRESARLGSQSGPEASPDLLRREQGTVQVNRDVFAHWFPNHTVYLLAYRGFGASEGIPTEEALAGDAVALFDRVARRHPGTGIDVIGRSLGTGSPPTSRPNAPCADWR